MSLACPLDCEYLQEAHKREKLPTIAERDLAHADVKVTEELLIQREELLLFCIYSLLQAALRTASAVDSDVMEALEASVQTYRTLDSGLVYETRAENGIAAAVQRLLTASVADYRKLQREQDALSPVLDSEVLKVLVFLQRIGQQNQNGRRKGRMFIDLLRQMTPNAGPAQPSPTGIII